MVFKPIATGSTILLKKLLQEFAHISRSMTALTAVAALSFGASASMSSAQETLTAIPYLSEISDAGFNVEVRKSAPVAAKPMAQKPKAMSSPKKTSSRAKAKPAQMPAKKYVVSNSGNKAVPRAYVIRPMPQDLKNRNMKEMRSILCGRANATILPAGYIVYTKDGQELGYMVDYTLGTAAVFKDFRVITFPKKFGKAECLHFNGTNPYPNERVGNNPKVAYTLQDIATNAHKFRVGR